MGEGRAWRREREKARTPFRWGGARGGGKSGVEVEEAVSGIWMRGGKMAGGKSAPKHLSVKGWRIGKKWREIACI